MWNQFHELFFSWNVTNFFFRQNLNSYNLFWSFHKIGTITHTPLLCLLRCRVKLPVYVRRTVILGFCRTVKMLIVWGWCTSSPCCCCTNLVVCTTIFLCTYTNVLYYKWLVNFFSRTINILVACLMHVVCACFAVCVKKFQDHICTTPQMFLYTRYR